MKGNAASSQCRAATQSGIDLDITGERKREKEEVLVRDEKMEVDKVMRNGLDEEDKIEDEDEEMKYPCDR